MVCGALIGQSAAHLRLLAMLEKVSPIDAEVLISGPTGVGKELYARHIHQNGPRHAARFVAVNCGAFPTELFENELFGHIGGAFTGARPRSEGLIAEAEKGTLFLDEVDSLSWPCQIKLLRFIQEKEYRRLGETTLRHANIRIVAATNANLFEATQSGRFREDLFFRLRVVPVEVPPLNQRPEDIPLLLEAFIAHYSSVYRLPKLHLSDEAFSCLLAYQWPGNVRELENCVKCLTCLQLSSPLRAKDLPLLENRNAFQTAQAPETAIADRPLRDVKRDLVNN
ncbi:MAG TPA: sigma-54 dependent transcriptional regulator, partial [Burkholderiales bacterium]|nr:sigma-54 dependent transcriptional regulator [Burkholderiales bacterium]